MHQPSVNRLRILTVAAALGAVTVPSPTGAQLPADSGAFVMRLGRDTLKVERFLLRDGVLRSESVRRGAGAEIQHVDAMLNPDGSVARVQVRLYNWAPDAPARPIDGSLAYVEADSTILEVGLPPTVRRITYPGRGDVFSLGATPFIFAWFVAVAARAPALVGDSLGGMHMTSTLAARPLTIRRIAPDWVTVHSSYMGTMRIRVDDAGRVRELDGTGSSVNYRGERTSWVDLDSVAQSFDRLHRLTGAIGVLSPRDSVITRVGGATLRVDYSRPSKRGRVVFGGIVPWNAVWRTGANLATHLTTDRTLAFGEAVVPPGTYTLFTLPADTGWTLIVNRQSGQWGTEYDPAQDLVRIPMRTRALAAPVETFTVVVEPRGRGGAIRLVWDGTEAFTEFSVR